jgi:hypothetical protein
VASVQIVGLVLGDLMFVVITNACGGECAWFKDVCLQGSIGPVA